MAARTIHAIYIALQALCSAAFLFEYRKHRLRHQLVLAILFGMVALGGVGLLIAGFPAH